MVSLRQIQTTTNMSAQQALPPIRRLIYRTLTDKEVCLVLQRYKVDFAFLDFKHLRLFAVASTAVRQRLILEWTSIIHATIQAARLAYPGHLVLNKKLAFRVCEAKYLDKDLKGPLAMVHGLFPAMVDGLIASELGSDTPASGAPIGKSPEGESDATREPDLQWRDFLADEVVDTWDLD